MVTAAEEDVAAATTGREDTTITTTTTHLRADTAAVGAVVATGAVECINRTVGVDLTTGTITIMLLSASDSLPLDSSGETFVRPASLASHLSLRAHTMNV